MQDWLDPPAAVFLRLQVGNNPTHILGAIPTRLLVVVVWVHSDSMADPAASAGYESAELAMVLEAPRCLEVCLPAEDEWEELAMGQEVPKFPEGLLLPAASGRPRFPGRLGWPRQ